MSLFCVFPKRVVSGFFSVPRCLLCSVCLEKDTWNNNLNRILLSVLLGVHTCSKGEFTPLTCIHFIGDNFHDMFCYRDNHNLGWNIRHYGRMYHLDFLCLKTFM